MKIGKPVTEVPAAQMGRSLKYQEVYAAVDELKAGQILPVEVASAKEAHTLALCMRSYLLPRGNRINQRGATIYITRAK